MPDAIKSISSPNIHAQTVVNPDGSDIGQQLPTAGNNPSLTITKVVNGNITTTTIQKVINSVTYTKTIVENSDTETTIISAWS